MKNMMIIAAACGCAMASVHAHEGQHVKTASRSQSSGAKSSISITEEGEKRIITANGIPAHDTGKFPNRNNPNTISVQSYKFEMPLKPAKLQRPVDARGIIFGVALNGVVFDPGTAETWKGDMRWSYEALTSDLNLGLDENHAHVQPTGAYHYHAMPNGLLKDLKASKDKMTMIGWAADGFPIYALYGYEEAGDSQSKLKKLKSSYRLKSGTREGGPGGKYDGNFTSDYEYVAGLGDLDECNGRDGVTPEFPQGTYYYVVSEEFPFIPRYFKAKPDSSFSHREFGGGRGPGGPGGPGGPPFGEDDRRGPGRRGGGPEGGRGEGPEGGRPPHPPHPPHHNE